MKTIALTKQAYFAKAAGSNVWNIKEKAKYKTQKIQLGPIIFHLFSYCEGKFSLNFINKRLIYQHSFFGSWK